MLPLHNELNLLLSTTVCSAYLMMEYKSKPMDRGCGGELYPYLAF
jgi:hypothetical protein